MKTNNSLAINAKNCNPLSELLRKSLAHLRSLYAVCLSTARNTGPALIGLKGRLRPVECFRALCRASALLIFLSVASSLLLKMTSKLFRVAAGCCCMKKSSATRRCLRFLCDLHLHFFVK
uniref:Condensin II complex subunit H2 N-terminal domain-containing protein n=1 Tax=Parascaris univalens TaxID=6257 RepID=A0A914ZHM5_PARUN